MVNFVECLIVYIDLDHGTKSFVQKAIGKIAKIETISLEDFSDLNLTELHNGGLLVFSINSKEDVVHYRNALKKHKKNTFLFRKLLLVKDAEVANNLTFDSSFDLLVCEEWASANTLLSSAISEQEARTQNQAFKAFLEHSVDGYWIWDIIRNQIEWSKRTSEIVGVSENESPKNIEAFVELIDPLDRDRVEQAINSHFTFKIPYRNVEMRLKGANNTYRHFMANGTALRNKEGTPVLFVGSLTDRTLMQKVEQRLEDTEKRFTVLFHQMNDAALLADIDTGFILEANQPAERLWGKPISDLVGLHQSKLHPPVLSEEAKLAFADHIKALMQNKRDTIYVPILRVDGVEVPAEISSSLIELEGKTRILGVFRDISDRVQLERDIRERDAQLQLSSHMASMGTLAAGVAHEINNPLTYVLGNLEILKTSIKKLGISNPEIEETISSAITGSQLVKEIVTDLKALSQSDESQTCCDPCEVIRIASRVAMSDLRHSSSLIMDLPQVPQVALSSARLSQIILNILSNSARAFKKCDSKFNEIKISVEKNAGYAQIVILDNGEGIDFEDLKRIWEPFFTKRTKSGGTGLGLSICRRILNEVKGSIEIESELGNYTRVTILIPFAKQVSFSSEEFQTTEKMLETLNYTPALMVVDDDTLVLKLITKMLEEVFLVSSYSDARMALTAFKEGEKPDVILSDIMMPDMDGNAFFESMCAQGAKQEQFLFMTGGAVTEDAMAFEKLMAGTNSLVTKPFQKAKLRQAIFNRVTSLIAAENIKKTSHVDDLNTQDDLTPSMVAELESLLGRDALKEQYRKLDQQIGDFFVQAQNLKARDLASLAHKVAGGAAMLGAENFAKTLRDVQKAAVEKDEYKIEKFLTDAKKTAKFLKHSISEYQNQ